MLAGDILPLILSAKSIVRFTVWLMQLLERSHFKAEFRLRFTLRLRRPMLLLLFSECHL